MYTGGALQLCELFESACHRRRNSGFVEAPGLAEECTAWVDQPLNYLEKLFYSTCGVRVEVVPVDGSDVAAAQIEQARIARLDRLPAETSASHPR